MNNFQVSAFLASFVKFEDSIFFVGFTEKPLSCVERGVASGPKHSTYNRLLDYK
jgi:hypothetical protein